MNLLGVVLALLTVVGRCDREYKMGSQATLACGIYLG